MRYSVPSDSICAISPVTTRVTDSARTRKLIDAYGFITSTRRPFGLQRCFELPAVTPQVLT